ncbi:MFS transporter [Sulfitobacter sp. LCG007]
MNIKTPRSSFPMIFVLWAAGLGAAAQYGKISVIFDQLPTLYPEAGPALGFVVSLVGLVGIFFGSMAGLLVARISYRRALIWGLWAGAAMSALQATTLPLGWLLASRVVEGASHLAIVVAAPTLIAQPALPGQRGFALTLWGTFFGVAFAVLAWAGRPLVALWGIPALFAAHALYMAAFAVLLGSLLPRLPDTALVDRLSLRALLRDNVAVYRSPATAAPAAGWLFYTFCFVSLLTVLPPFLEPQTRAFVLGAMPLASIATSMTLGVFLLRHISAVRVIETGFGSAALASLWLITDPGAPAGCLVLSCAMGLVQGASFAAVPQLNGVPSDQARANGALAQAGNLGNTIGTPVMAAIAIEFDHTGLMLMAAAMFFGGLLVHALLAQARRLA